MDPRIANKRTDPQLISVDRLREFCDPFFNPPWEGVASLTVEGVKQAMVDGFFEKKPYSAARRPEIWTVEDHIARIAHLAVHGWDDPIDLDVGIPSLGAWVSWMVQDGNHRLAAAIVRDDSFIRSTFSGSYEYMSSLFGNPLYYEP
jgi:hypothetical protein